MRPLGERDVLVNGTALYQLVLEYALELTEAAEVTNIWPGLQGVLYESEFHGQLFMVFDAKKKLLFVGDSWPKRNKLSKGKYTVRIQIRHEKIAILELLVDMPMVTLRTLKNSINLSIYKTQSEALMGNDNDTFGSRSLSIGTSVGMFIKEPTYDQFPKGIKAGDALIGSITYLKKNGNKGIGADERPSGFSLTYQVADIATAASNGDAKKEDAGGSESTPTALDKLQSVVKDAKIKHVKSLIGTESFEEMYASVSTEYSDNLQLKLHCVSHRKKILEDKGECRDACLEAIEAVVKLIDADELAKAYGVLLPLVGKEGEEKKNALATVYALKAKLLLDTAATEETPSLDECEATIKELQKWADVNADKHWALVYGKHKLQKNWGTALKKVTEMISNVNDGKTVADTSYDKLLKECLLCLQEMGWEHIAAGYKKWSKVAVKSEYDPF